MRKGSSHPNWSVTEPNGTWMTLMQQISWDSFGNICENPAQSVSSVAYFNTGPSIFIKFFIIIDETALLVV